MITGVGSHPLAERMKMLRVGDKRAWSKRRFTVRMIADELGINSERQRWSRGHKARGQGQTLSRPRTKNTDASVLQKKRSSKIFFRWFQKKVFKKFFQAKKIFKYFFQAISTWRNKKKRSLQIFRKVSGVFQRNFNGSKLVLSSSRGLEASRPRTSKCVLEAKDVLEDSTSCERVWRIIRKIWGWGRSVQKWYQSCWM